MTSKYRGSMFTGGGGGVHQRQVDDFYATPHETTKKILNEIKLEGSILECACVTGDTEFFNGYEWKPISEYTKDDKVLVFTENGEGKLVYPQKYIKTKADKFNYFENHLISMSLCDNHNVVYYDYRNRLKKITMKEVVTKHYNDSNGFRGKIPTSWILDGTLELNEWELRLAIACSADGRIRSNKTNHCLIRVKKDRKKERLLWILENAKIEYKYNYKNEYHEISFYSPLGMKIFPKEWYNLSLRCKNIIIDEIFHWDGCIQKTNTKVYYTSEKENFDFIQYLLHSSGYSANVNIKDRRNKKNRKNKSLEYCITLLNKKYTSMGNSSKRVDIKEIIPEGETYKYCFTVETGMFVARHNHKIFITGNCGQGHISEVLKEYYPDQKIISTDIVDRGYADELKDFLNDDFEKVDNVITNPPFKYAKEFVEKALEISNDKVVMLLKIQFLESKSRKEFLENSPLKYVYVFSERQNTMKDGSPINPLTGKPWSSTMLLAWFVWEKGYEGEPIVRWL